MSALSFSFPSPLVGEGRVGGREGVSVTTVAKNRRFATSNAHHLPTPTPNPSPQGGGES